MNDAKYIHGTQPSEQQRLAALNELVNPAFLQFLALDGAKAVLEVGSGMGLLTHEAARRLPDACVVGVEFSRAQLAKANRELGNLRFIQANAHYLPLADDSFDVVYCRWLLEHVADPLRVLQEMRRVVRPGGRVLVMENDTSLQSYDPPAPHFDKVWRQFSLLQQELGGDSLIGRRLFRLLKAAGLQDIQMSMAPEVYWSGAAGFAVWVANEAAIVKESASELIARGLATAEDVSAALAELDSLAERDDATSWFYWNRATGRKR
jgi:ubiquinone/menaquinone biosynthesis C-methylase UbiE